MKKKELEEHISTLFGHFNDPCGVGEDESIANRIEVDLYGKELEYLDAFFEKEYKKGFKAGEELHQNFLRFYLGIMRAAFSYGYVVGQILDPGYDEVNEARQAILNDIKKNKLLLYLPRAQNAVERG